MRREVLLISLGALAGALAAHYLDSRISAASRTFSETTEPTLEAGLNDVAASPRDFRSAFDALRAVVGNNKRGFAATLASLPQSGDTEDLPVEVIAAAARISPPAALRQTVLIDDRAERARALERIASMSSNRRLAISQRESAQIAAELVTQACQDGNVDPRGLVLHSDNGLPMRSSTMLATLQWLGIVPSFSRPHISDDNPYSEALFRTLKHTPAYPDLPFSDIASAQRWVARFVNWYNQEHRHSAIRYVTPDERHFGHEHDILARRQRLYERARNLDSERWARTTRNWNPIGAMVLHPEKPAPWVAA